ncbi:energy transducer TonB [Bradyrhizobium sp. 2TAF24]|uniref:energy transducer TonB n=1 Tax=Bradyrhizobium sp. 2TAF24 TaxID=3233011 RepID=UPI003F9398C4
MTSGGLIDRSRQKRGVRAPAVPGVCVALGGVLLAAVSPVGPVASAAAQALVSSAVPAPIRFDLPAQPLAKALQAFSAATNIEVLVDARHAAGRRSSDVQGAMMPREALALLLAGSGLVAQPFTADEAAFKIVAPPVPAPVAGLPPGATRYFRDIQRAVELALCRDGRTAPGRYRLALKLWIGQSGVVLRSQRLDTTGDDALDGALDEVTRALPIGRSPPADLPQPVVLVISPQRAAVSAGCLAAAPEQRRAAVGEP